jgi:hypothetical protein
VTSMRPVKTCADAGIAHAHAIKAAIQAVLPI